jgi:hypothetical protein
MVQLCVQSWIRQNPSWTVHVLDATSVIDALGSDELSYDAWPGISIQHFSDLIRLALLKKHGGVWADASMYCVTPLDRWLVPNMQTGFFAFRGIRRGRTMGNPFMASLPKNLIPSKMFEKLSGHVRGRTYIADKWPPLRVAHYIMKPLMEISPKTTKIWFKPPFSTPCKVYPYFVFHYMFNLLLEEDSEFARIWAETPLMSATPMLRIKHGRNSSSLPEDIRLFILSGEQPIHKLTWDADLSRPYWSEAVEALQKASSDLLQVPVAGQSSVSSFTSVR